MNSLAKGAVLLTGAASGIGQTCVLALVRLGFHVFAGVRQVRDGDRLQQQAGAQSGLITPVILDVTDRATIQAACDLVTIAVGDQGLRGVVNNAGISIPGTVEFLSLDDLRQQLEVNLVGAVAVTQAFLPLLRQAQGRMVNVGSIAGRLAIPFASSYCASKAALAALTEALRMELRPWGIAVSLIEPGSIRTPIWEKSLRQADQALERLPPEALALYGSAFAKARVAVLRELAKSTAPEPVAQAIVYALTDPHPKARYLVGRDAHLRSLLSTLPDWLRDRLILQAFGLL